MRNAIFPVLASALAALVLPPAIQQNTPDSKYSVESVAIQAQQEALDKITQELETIKQATAEPVSYQLSTEGPAPLESTDALEILKGPAGYPTLEAAVTANATTLKKLLADVDEIRTKLQLKSSDAVTVSESGSITVDKVVTTPVYEPQAYSGGSSAQSAYIPNGVYAQSGTAMYSGGSTGTNAAAAYAAPVAYESYAAPASQSYAAPTYQRSTARTTTRTGLFGRRRVSSGPPQSSYSSSGTCRVVVGADGMQYRVCD